MDHRFFFLIIFGLFWLICKIARFGRRDEKLPPGPPTIPILGNIHLLPLQFPFLKFTEWAKEYGGIISLKVANGTVIIISDMTIVKELLDERSHETSSRPSLYAADVVTDKNYFALATSDSHIWKIGRKVVQPLMAPQAVQAHLPVVDVETRQLLYDILHHPEEFCSHVSRATLSFVTSVVFGKPTPRHGSTEASLFRAYMRHFSRTVAPAAAPVDLVPLLKYVPERLAPWKQLWRTTRQLQKSLYFSLLEYAEERISTGHRNGSLVESIIDKQVELGYIGGIMLDGAETSASLIQSLVLCLIDSPESLRKAQDETDNVLGDLRFPAAHDIQSLPYVQAMIKEVHRLRPAGPAGIPHATREDCQYRGYTIPKGTPILTNVWGIFHNPDLFERPEEFWPERCLLTPDGTKPGLEKGYTICLSLPFGSDKVEDGSLLPFPPID
ncbi:hypothetical protein CVT25_004820 [Psilocybe cyanescens]|uniref:Cytochrome P450 n=1 Tax=Psilocybe cyanescens TaxID=93625 RepID=A0A409VY72_PSICY|nr:hypothetical protein CVT25_004820 [Psilocybe cyanescens]